MSSEQTNNDDSKKTESTSETKSDEQPTETSIPQGIPAAEHSAYKKFFKMLQVGVPLPAVQLKMQSEGLDPSILRYHKQYFVNM